MTIRISVASLLGYGPPQSFDLAAVLGFGTPSSEPLPSASEGGGIVIRVPPEGLSRLPRQWLQHLCWRGDIVDLVPWKVVPAGTYRIILRDPLTNHCFFHEQKETLRDRLAPGLLVLATLLCIGGHGAGPYWIRCPEQSFDGAHLILIREHGKIRVEFDGAVGLDGPSPYVFAASMTLLKT